VRPGVYRGKILAMLLEIGKKCFLVIWQKIQDSTILRFLP
jgi:hypothetical protein